MPCFTGIDKEKKEKEKTRQLQNIYACTSPPEYLWVTCLQFVDAPHQRKNSPFIFKYRPLGPIYFNIWGKFTIVDV